MCITGPSGIGKTLSVKFISELLQTKENYIFFPFHKDTKISELYGTFDFKKEAIEYYKGPLIESVQKGLIFIAEEMNLCSISTMKSIIPFLDPLLKTNLILPGLDEPIDINNNFFFIVCQNDFDNLGRNSIPEKLQRKLRHISYPVLTKEEIQKICIEKGKKELYFKFGKQIISKDFELLGEFVSEYNKILDKYKLPLLKWSFRDIDKIIKRISEHIIDENYINFKYYHFIYFYLFEQIPKDYFDKIYHNKTLQDILHSLFINVFHLEKKSDELKRNHFEKAKVDIENNIIMKGNIGIKFDCLKEKVDGEIIYLEELSNYVDDFFKLNLISEKESVLLMGPSSYKTHLAKYFMKSIKYKNMDVFNLNQKTTIEELLGCPIILPQYYMFNFYYYLLKDITNYSTYYKRNLNEEVYNLREKISQRNPYMMKEILNHLFNNLVIHLKNIETNNNQIVIKNMDSHPNFVFKPGSILLSILKHESFILKNIDLISPGILERFNELFDTKKILSLNEDIYGTFFKKLNKKENGNSKCLKYLDNINIFATCSENSFKSLSDSVLSRFSIICVGEHGIKEKEKIIRNYLRKSDLFSDEILETIFKIISEKLIKQNFKINKIKNLIDIFNEMNKNNVNNQELEKIYNNLNYVIHYIDLNNRFKFYN